MKKILKNFGLAFSVLALVLTFVLPAAVPVQASSYKFLIESVVASDFGNDEINVNFMVMNGSDLTGELNTIFVSSSYANEDEFRADVLAKVLAWAHTHGYSSLVESDIIMTLKPNLAKTFNNTASHSFVTTAAAANGFQLSATKDTSASYSVTVSSAVQIGVVANVSGYAVLEIAPTNSSTAGDWQEVSRVGTGQNIGLAIALSSTQTVTAPLSAIIPAGYYARIRTVNSNGTPTYTFVSGQEVQL